MTFSQYAGVAIVPTLARLVLAAVFLLAGYSKLFTRMDFESTADGQGAADRLHAWGVALTPKNAAPPASGAFRSDVEFHITLAAHRQDATDVQDEPAPQPPSDESPESLPPPQPPAEQPAPDSEPAPPPQPQTPTTVTARLAPGTYTAPTLYMLAIMLDDAKWPYPVAQAWLASLTEFVGGGMLLIGLFSRIWGLGLAIVMGVAFYLTSLPALKEFGIFNLPPMQSTGLFVQSALFVLALGIALTGPGPLSLDRILFSRPSPGDTEPPENEPRRVPVRS